MWTSPTSLPDRPEEDYSKGSSPTQRIRPLHEEQEEASEGSEQHQQHHQQSHVMSYADYRSHLAAQQQRVQEHKAAVARRAAAEEDKEKTKVTTATSYLYGAEDVNALLDWNPPPPVAFSPPDEDDPFGTVQRTTSNLSRRTTSSSTTVHHQHGSSSQQSQQQYAKYRKHLAQRIPSPFTTLSETSNTNASSTSQASPPIQTKIVETKKQQQRSPGGGAGGDRPVGVATMTTGSSPDSSSSSSSGSSSTESYSVPSPDLYPTFRPQQSQHNQNQHQSYSNYRSTLAQRVGAAPSVISSSSSAEANSMTALPGGTMTGGADANVVAAAALASLAENSRDDYDDSTTTADESNEDFNQRMDQITNRATAAVSVLQQSPGRRAGQAYTNMETTESSTENDENSNSNHQQLEARDTMDDLILLNTESTSPYPNTNTNTSQEAASQDATSSGAAAAEQAAAALEAAEDASRVAASIHTGNAPDWQHTSFPPQQAHLHEQQQQDSTSGSMFTTASSSAVPTSTTRRTPWDDIDDDENEEDAEIIAASFIYNEHDDNDDDSSSQDQDSSSEQETGERPIISTTFAAAISSSELFQTRKKVVDDHVAAAADDHPRIQPAATDTSTLPNASPSSSLVSSNVSPLSSPGRNNTTFASSRSAMSHPSQRTASTTSMDRELLIGPPKDAAADRSRSAGGSSIMSHPSGSVQINGGKDTPTRRSNDNIEAQLLSSPTESERAHGRKLYQRRKMCQYGILAFIFVAIPLAIGLGIGLSSDRRSSRDVDGIDDGSVPTMSPLAPAMAPTAAPTGLRPTSSPAPISAGAGALFDLLATQTASFNGGQRILTPDSAPNQAFVWLAESPNLNELSEAQQTQRFALATLFYATNGGTWTTNTGWLDYDGDECTDWFSRSTSLAVCNNNGDYVNLDLGFNNLTGTIDVPELSLLSSLRRVDLSGSSGSINNDIGEQMVVSSGMTGSLPTTQLAELKAMQSFNVRDNSISGPFFTPELAAAWTDVRLLDLRQNQFSGSFSNEVGQMQNLVDLSLSNNNFNGTLTDAALGPLTKLRRLRMDNNAFTGGLPTSIGQLQDLQTLNLGFNRLTEPLPSQLGTLGDLQTLQIQQNNMTGPLFDDWSAMTNLTRLELSANAMTGPLPDSLGSMSSLLELDLSSNGFSNTIPTTLGDLTTLIALLLQSNELTGNIPVELASMDSLFVIRLDDNNLTGAVPDEVCTTISSGFTQFYVDCGGDPPEVTCPPGTCCTYCCEDGVGCECQYAGTTLEFLC